ncbi:MAG: AbrB/MazE/SpoVT family DNA-binding domain-containing protein [Candidatus Hydrothermarchaeales archaeon]
MAYVIVGQKGQVTLKKKLRERYSITVGALVEELPTEEGILIKPIKRPMKRWESLSETVSKKWPADISTVSALKEDRTK